MPNSKTRMTEQMRRLEAFFKSKVVDLDEDDGDDNSFGDYWEFNDPYKVKYWSLELFLMTEWTYFVHNFQKLLVFFPILHEERV
jgi:hypothetical protein